MNVYVNAIAGRLSLRLPRRRSLETLDRITKIVPPRKGADVTRGSERYCPSRRPGSDRLFVGDGGFQAVFGDRVVGSEYGFGVGGERVAGLLQ